MAVEILRDIEQGTDAWLRARLGVPTASNFSAILARGEGKTRRSYMMKLASEIITGEVGESFSTPAMDRGKVMEAEARELYAFLQDEPLEQVGFVLNGNRGASPDSLVGRNGGLEIKTQRGDLLAETLLKGDFPPEHKAQVQGNLLVCERDWWDLIVFWPRMPLFRCRVARDEPYLKRLDDEINRFSDELQGVVERLRKVGSEGMAA